MRVTLCDTLPILVLSALLLNIQPALAGTPTPAQPAVTDAQIVRLSYVEGDVRVSRGKTADKQDAKQSGESTGWEQAVANLPIESGYSLVTGKGRAEIEFEDASTVYLGGNSVLTFTEISSTGGVPYTEIALLSGTATMNVHTMAPGEWFKLTTPTDNISLRYPRSAVWRIDSYLDAVSITPQKDPAVTQPELVAAQAKMIGKTTTYTRGRRVLPDVTGDPAAASEWDAWVARRLAARTEALSAAMKDAGLASPIPGLAEMNGQGNFFSCAPYGTCWEPANGWEGNAPGATEVSMEMAADGAGEAEPPAAARSGATAAPRTAHASKALGQSAVDAYVAAHPGSVLRAEDYFFPCSTFAVRDMIATDPVTGQDVLVAAIPYFGDYPPFGMYPLFAGYRNRGIGPFMAFGAWGPYAPWEWAVCHSGSWIRWHHRYAWVAGTRRHHHRPVRWVKAGRTVGFVPIHPRDVAGKPPINLKDGLFKVTGKKDSPVDRIAYLEGKPLTLLDEAPKEFRRPELEPLKPAEVPRAQAYSAYTAAAVSAGVNSAAGIAIASPTARGFAPNRQGTPITFDRRSQSFSVATQVTQGGRSATVAQPLGPRPGNFEAGTGGSQSRPASTGGSYSNNGSSSRSSAPAPSYSGGSSGGGYSRPSAPAPSAPAPSYSAPSAPSPASSSSSPAHH